jgi:hypothetical protein
MDTVMAKRAIWQLSWRWPGWLRAASLTAALQTGFWCVNPSHAADGVPVNTTSSNAITALLEFQETGYYVIGWGVSLKMQATPFRKEPPAASGKTIRGILNFNGNPSNSIPFVWQRDARKLFLDLNRNRDLTDDAASVFSSRDESSITYQMFTNIHLLFNTASGRCPVLADINLYDYTSQLGGIVEVRSFWQGKVTLNGRDWQMGIVQEDSKQPGSFEGGQLLLRPWENRNRAFTTSDNTLATVPWSQKLFVDGHAYQLDVETRTQNGEARPALRFMEQAVPLGELNVSGKYIKRLVLSGGTYQVVVDQPAGTVKIPTGVYSLAGISISLAQNGTEARCDSGQSPMAKWISVDGKTAAMLEAGGPLTNCVTATRDGQDLRLDYKLIGAGGATYQLVNQDRSKPPTFAIYKGDRIIASGAFEFG